MRSIADRIRCAVCRRTMGDGAFEAKTMNRIAPCKLAHVFFLCSDCLELPPEDHVMDIALGLQ